jgi:hypothetical protein
MKPSRPTLYTLIATQAVLLLAAAGASPSSTTKTLKSGAPSSCPTSPSPCTATTPPRVIIPPRGGTMKLVPSTGAVEVHNREEGKAYWLPANPPNTTHADVNGGTDPIEVMVVELEKEK